MSISYDGWRSIMNENCYRFKLGEFECVVLQDGTKNQPTQAIHEEIPQEELSRVLREHGLPTDEVAFGYNCLLVKAGMDNILIDTGYGWYSEEGGQLVSSLTEAGITTTDIDIIIFTHADGDHVGGTLDPEGKEIYPNARYVLPSVSWEYWTS
jgi:flavorubredoxin